MTGALVVALIAGTSTFIVLTILGAPFAAPLAVVAGLFSLVPLVGATIAAVLIGIVTLFGDFPTDTILWAVWAIVYQQIENNLIQPQVQKRTVNVNGFVVLVSVLFGATLLGVLGALVAIPIAASIQIVIREWWNYRRETPDPAGSMPEAGATGPAPDARLTATAAVSPSSTVLGSSASVLLLGGRPASSSRPRSTSAFSSAPSSTATLEIHSQIRNTITPPRLP